MQISLGCGNKEEKDFFGYDSRYYGWNTVWKAPNPIPLEDETVDFVKAHKFLEHIPRESWIPFFNECHRVLKSGCKLELIVPNAERNLSKALQDITHLSLWVTDCVKYLTLEEPGNSSLGILPWKVERACEYEPGSHNDHIVLVKVKKLGDKLIDKK